MSEQQPGTFTYFDAAIWTAGVTFVLLLAAALAHGDAERVDMVKIAAVQVAVYLLACALFSWRRPGRNFSELFAIRRASPWLLVLCLLLGPALFGPAQTLDRLVDHFAPEPPARIQEALEALLPSSPLHGGLLLLMLALGGPLVEELLFRGAIYTALRPGFGAASALWATTLCFTLSHPRPREWLLILLPALILSLLRARSGSLWPGFLVHAGFNASQLVVLWSVHGQRIAVPLHYEIGGWLLSAALLGGALFIAQSSRRAQEARSVDEIAPPAVEHDL